MFLSEWREFPSAPCLAGGEKNLMTARVSMLLKSRASLTCFRAFFRPGRAKDLSALRYCHKMAHVVDKIHFIFKTRYYDCFERAGQVSTNTSLDSFFCDVKGTMMANIQA